ncbi:MAG: type II toxin-antitoxin system VapC family toxin [Planctomycetaceae bacterium]
MNLLLDTCAFLWMCSQPDLLSSAAADAVEDENSVLHLSHASVWEMALKYRTGKLPLPDPPRIWIPDEARFHNIELVLIDADAIFTSCEFTANHRDPFDRLIAAHAKINGLTVVSPDPAFAKLGVDVLW